MWRRKAINRQRCDSIAMNLRTITVRAIVIALVVGFSGLLCALRAIGSNPSAVIRDRGSVRARLLMPKAFRAFSVEEYVKPGDDFAYTVSKGPGSLRRWRLRINTASARRKHWEDAFGNYVEKLRFRKSHSYQRGSNKLYRRYRASNNDYYWLILENMGDSGDLHITFAYHAKPGGAEIRKYMGLVAFHVRRFWHSLWQNDASYNSITRAS